MTLRDLQLIIRDKLDASKALQQGRCKAFAEDALDAALMPEPALHAGAGGVALVIRTPSAQLSGALPAPQGIPLSATLAVDAIEVPALRGTGALTATGAASAVAHLLHDGVTVNFDRFESDLVRDGETRYYIFTAVFTANFTLTQQQR